MKIGVCVYCGKHGTVEDDHVPPKLIFPKPRPSDLITVPACSECNHSAGKDEEYFLAVLMFSSSGVSEAGKKLWDEKLTRMYKKNRGLEALIARSFEPVTLVIPAGLLIGRRLGIHRELSRFESVINKITRGLYYSEYNAPLPESSHVESLITTASQDASMSSQFSSLLRSGSRGWPGVFEYRFNRTEDELCGSLWRFTLYSTACFWAITCNDDTYRAA